LGACTRVLRVGHLRVLLDMLLVWLTRDFSMRGSLGIWGCGRGPRRTAKHLI
jgi:hypothetical protein